MTGPDVDFGRIRAYGAPAGRAAGFEELASLVVTAGVPGLVEWPAGTAFDRFGNPDGGREGKGVLPGGDVWAWQAKYLFRLGDSELGQVDASVRRVLETEPNLRRYIVVLPYDRPAGDTRRSRSAYTKWLGKTVEWERLAAERGMDVEFVYVGASELVTELTKTENAGRLRYWFGTSVLTPEEQRDRLSDVLNKVGRRYTPQLHVEVPTVEALEGLGRTEAYILRIQHVLADLRRIRAYRRPLQNELAAAAAVLADFLTATRSGARLPPIASDLESAHAALADAVAGADPLTQSVYRTAVRALEEALGLVRSVATEAADRGLLLMTGRAGVGKTHLFCDVAARRIEAGLPTVVLLGQDFDDGALLPQLGRLAGIDGRLDDVLGVLDAAGEAAGRPAMLMIDAINETARADRWADELRVLAGAVDRHPHVVLAVSCRTEFVEPVADGNDFPHVEHIGFAESTAEAVARYTAEYGLERVTFPILDPEFGNPLFLKLACEGLSTLGRQSLGNTGLTTVCDVFLEAVNERLAKPSRCDYDRASDLVRSVTRQLAELGPGPYRRADVIALADATLPNRRWSQSLYVGLLREGVLLEATAGTVVFSYQRLGDVQRATLLAERTPTELRDWYRALDDATSWAENGVIGALGLILPETSGHEIADLFADETGRADRRVVDAFLQSLTLRAPEHTTERTTELVTELLPAPEAWLALVRVACVPGHAANADFLHRVLSGLSLPERDRTWSEWLASSAHDETAVLLDWAWPEVRGPRQNGSSQLATLTIGWFLTSTVRALRDRATKALVAIGEDSPAEFAAAVRAFRGCDDPYVVERLTGALCAVALRSTSADVITAVADAAAELVVNGVPTHLVTRDNLRRIAETATAHGWTGPNWRPPYDAAWPVEVLREEEHTTVGFGRDVLRPSLDALVTDDRERLFREARRAVDVRAVELGGGEKYRWIGLYETLGRLADHHRPHDLDQLIGRDIDPTVLVRPRADQAGWFAPAAAFVDEPEVLDGVPDPLDLIALIDPDGTRWLSLVRYDTWTEDLPPEIAAADPPILNIWMQTRSYLVRADDVAVLRTWAAGQDYEGRWMPEHPEINSRLLATYPTSPDWDVDTVDTNLPFPVELPNYEYTGTGTTRDTSGAVTGYLPSRLLYDVFSLRHGNDFAWPDSTSRPAVIDPTAGMSGVGALLMRRDLTDALARAGYTLFWTALVRKELLNDGYDEYRGTSASASYLLTDGTIERI
ncbi:hypothetical protein ACFV9C_33840 [Kribbella sp. NPDC059898]|uniref:hypothetical protein n=1 Tax=Kribbella sp. NPDC059898 TaxID=3346995 RepID=UPI003664435C